jgi:hypothetical protein
MCVCVFCNAADCDVNKIRSIRSYTSTYPNINPGAPACRFALRVPRSRATPASRSPASPNMPAARDAAMHRGLVARLRRFLHGCRPRESSRGSQTKVNEDGCCSATFV